MVRLAPRAQRSRAVPEVISDVRARIERSLPEVRVEFVQVLQDVLNDLSGSPRPRASVKIRSTTKRWFSLVLPLCLFACKDREAKPAPELAALSPALTQTGDAAEEQGTIAGAAGGTPFTRVAAAFVIESPDADATTVVYLFSNPVRCLDLSFSGWDRTVENGTLVLELRLLGKAPGSFLAVTDPTFSAHEAAAEWMRTSADPPPVDVRSKGGWITLDSLSPRGPATGTFSLDFGASQLAGSFKAAFCAGGHEP